MLGRSAGIVAACALGASAFLIPPTITDIKHDKLAFVSADPKHQIIELPCSSCAFPSKHEAAVDTENGDGLFYAQGGAYNLVLNASISTDGKSLEINEKPVYPPAGLERDWYIQQISSSVSIEDVTSGKDAGTPLKITGFGMQVLDKQPMSPAGDDLIPLNIQIFSLEGQPMTIPEVFVQLLNIDGELLILSVEPIQGNMLEDLDLPGPPTTAPPAIPGSHPPKECSVLPPALCRLRDMVESKLEKLRHGKFGGCPGRQGGPPNKLPTHIKGPHFEQDEERPRFRPHHGRPHHMRPHGRHGRHGHHRHHHHIFHAFVKGFVAVLIPVMAGITVGMTVSLLGLLVGRLIGWFWIRVVRGGRRGYASVAQEEEIVDEGDVEKEVIVQIDAEELPAYEDAPAYEEVEKEVR